MSYLEDTEVHIRALERDLNTFHEILVQGRRKTDCADPVKVKALIFDVARLRDLAYRLSHDECHVARMLISGNTHNLLGYFDDPVCVDCTCSLYSLLLKQIESGKSLGIPTLGALDNSLSIFRRMSYIGR